jgi:hypothetical protein
MFRSKLWSFEDLIAVVALYLIRALLNHCLLTAMIFLPHTLRRKSAADQKGSLPHKHALSPMNKGTRFETAALKISEEIDG